MLRRVRAGLVEWASLPAEDQAHMDSTRKILETAAYNTGENARAQYALALRYVKVNLELWGTFFCWQGACRIFHEQSLNWSMIMEISYWW